MKEKLDSRTHLDPGFTGNDRSGLSIAPLVPRHRPGDVNHTGELAIQLDEPPARGRPARSVESSL